MRLQTSPSTSYTLKVKESRLPSRRVVEEEWPKEYEIQNYSDRSQATPGLVPPVVPPVSIETFVRHVEKEGNWQSKRTSLYLFVSVTLSYPEPGNGPVSRVDVVHIYYRGKVWCPSTVLLDSLFTKDLIFHEVFTMLLLPIFSLFLPYRIKKFFCHLKGSWKVKFYTKMYRKILNLG